MKEEIDCEKSPNGKHEYRQKLNATYHYGYYCIYCLEEVNGE